MSQLCNGLAGMYNITSVQSVCGEHISCLGIGISDEGGRQVRYRYPKQ